MITGAIVVSPPVGTGASGAPPIVGPTGQSAYQLAVAAGFTGTQAQWLASLQGAPGPAGPAGAVASLANLPTALPATSGVLWNNGGELAIS